MFHHPTHSQPNSRFRWVYCQLDYLSDCIPGRIRHALDEIPGTLDGTYERTLRGIKGTDWEFVRRLFQCVTVASRPLRAEELAEFLAFDVKAGPIPKFRGDWRLEDPLGAVLSTCSTLLALVNVNDSPVIQFSHFSVKEFLTSTRFAEKCDTISCRYHVSMTPAHTLVAQACLGMLLHLDGNITKSVLKKFPLAEYAAQYWVEHARFEGVSEITEEGMKHLFDRSKRHFAVWVWIFDPRMPLMRYNRPEKPVPPRGSPLHYAVLCGLLSIVESLVIESPKDVHSRDCDHKYTPLHLASELGHVEIARLLVEHGADAIAMDKSGLTPLHVAAHKRRWDLVRSLTEYGSGLAAKYGHGQTLLHRAVDRGSLGLARLLLEHGANVEARKENGSTPLLLAALYGSEGLARLLLEHGADATTRIDKGLSLLRWAVENGRENFARLLLEHGADITAEHMSGATMLFRAVEDGREDFARLFLEHGADVTAKNEDGSTLLHRAVENGSEDLARLLFEHGADITAEHMSGATMLFRAVEDGREDFARLFLEHGADVAAKDKDKWTVLHYAVEYERKDLVRLFLEHGADATAKSMNGSTPLRQAVRKGRMDLVRLLVDYGGADATADGVGGLGRNLGKSLLFRHAL